MFTSQRHSGFTDMPTSKDIGVHSIKEDEEHLMSRTSSETIDVEEAKMDEWEKSRQPPKKTRKHSLIIQYATCLLALLTLVTVLARSTFHSAPRNQKLYLDCGNSPAEAMVKGCIFDIMNYAWTPPECYDEEYSKSSLLAGPWRWFTDKNATQQIPHDPEVLGQHTEVWTEQSYHVAHCMYSQGLIHRAAKRKRPVMGEIGIWNHTLHCQSLFEVGKMVDPPEKVNTWVRTQWTPCVHMSEELWEL